MILLYTLLGAWANRFRGGLWTDEMKPFKMGSQVRRLLYCFIFSLVYLRESADVKGALLVFLILFVSLLTGWGRPIGALGGWDKRPIDEFNGFYVQLKKFKLWLLPVPLDWLSDKLVPDRMTRTKGFVWLTLWGLVVGGLINLATGLTAPLVAFGLMGVIYYISFEVSQFIHDKRDEGWPIAEWAFGAVTMWALVS